MLGTALLLVALQVGQPAQPPPPPPTGLILGRVVDAASGRPVAGAIVALQNVSMIMPGAPLPGSQPRAMTNTNGQFIFRRLPKGSFGLSVSKPGYADGAYGRRRPGGSQAQVELIDGQRLGDVAIPIWKHAAITGTVTDEAGEPLVGVELRVFERRYLAGRQRLVAGAAQTTDDRGVYRFGSLTPGDYVVAFVSKEVTLPAVTAELLKQSSNTPQYQELSRERMSMGTAFMGSMGGGVPVGDSVRQFSPSAPVPPPSTAGGPVYVYPTQYFPGTPSLGQAKTLTLKSGEARESIDLSLRPVKTARVSGTLLGPDGPVGNVALRLVPDGDDFSTELETSATMSSPAGDFSFFGVTPGQYSVKILQVPRLPVSAAMPNMTSIQVGDRTIMSSSTPPGAAPPQIPSGPTLWASVPVAVAGDDVTGVAVILQPGARLTGRLEFDGAAERPNPQQLTRLPITVDRTDRTATPGFGNTIPPGRVEESGVFRTYGLPGGKYLVRVVGAPPGWTLRSVVSEGRDISETPLEVGAADVSNIVITFSDRPSKLTGVVRGPSGTPDPEALVVVFPAESAAWSESGPFPRRMRSARPARTGTYTFTGLPPGEYFVAAIKEEFLSAWQYPEMLETLSRLANTVRLAEGETRTQDLKTAVVR